MATRIDGALREWNPRELDPVRAPSGPHVAAVATHRSSTPWRVVSSRWSCAH